MFFRFLVTAGASVAVVVALVHQVRSGALQLAWDREHYPERFIAVDIERQRRELLAARYAPTRFQVGSQGQTEQRKIF